MTVMATMTATPYRFLPGRAFPKLPLPHFQLVPLYLLLLLLYLAEGAKLPKTGLLYGLVLSTLLQPLFLAALLLFLLPLQSFNRVLFSTTPFLHLPREVKHCPSKGQLQKYGGFIKLLLKSPEDKLLDNQLMWWLSLGARKKRDGSLERKEKKNKPFPNIQMRDSVPIASEQTPSLPSKSKQVAIVKESVDSEEDLVLIVEKEHLQAG